MAAMPDQYGVDPSTQQPMPMPNGPQVDPNSPPADPMLAQPGTEAEYEIPEVEEREHVELCVLQAIERCAKGVQVGEGASNAAYAQQYAQAAASLGQCYAALAQAEVAEGKSGGPVSPSVPSNPLQQG